MQSQSASPTWSPGPDPEVGEPVRDPGRGLVELAVGAAARPADQRLALGHVVGHALEEIREVELHR